MSAMPMTRCSGTEAVCLEMNAVADGGILPLYSADNSTVTSVRNSMKAPTKYVIVQFMRRNKITGMSTRR